MTEIPPATDRTGKILDEIIRDYQQPPTNPSVPDRRERVGNATHSSPRRQELVGPIKGDPPVPGRKIR